MSGDYDGQLVEGLPDAESDSARGIPGPAMREPSVQDLIGESYEAPRLSAPPESVLFSAETVPAPPPMRFPNFADLGMAAVLLIFGGIAAAALAALALRMHLFGIATEKQALGDIRYALGSQLIWYLLSFAGCLLLFPAVWRTKFFVGVEWRAFAALRARRRLVYATLFCFAMAIADSLLLPGPENAPIDEAFRRPEAAWFMFIFGITLAPFFEEMFFRGFLLPALCTAYDWAGERMAHRGAPQPDVEGKTVWSLPAMAFGSILASIPFAWMHAAQTGHSVGPFVLLFCVSLVLCAVRLGMRSLAASTFVHASYNFMLFSLMLAETGGFQHLDKL